MFSYNTSPYREKNDIRDSINKLIKNNLDSLFSGCEDKSLFWIIYNKKLKPIIILRKKELESKK